MTTSPAKPHPLQEEPYLAFFPLGILLSWAGVLHWLLLAVGVTGRYRSIFHAMTQIQGFLMCFAAGFLFTMIPRRTGSAPPTRVELAIALAAPVTTTIAAWYGHIVVAQAAWLALAATLFRFAVSRFVSSSSLRKPPNSFVWIPIALLMGVAGSAMTSALALGPQYAWLHDVGRGMLLQGMFIALVLGVGGLALPLMTRGEAPPDAGATPRDTAARAAHVVGAAILVTSFFIEGLYSLRLGLALRAIVVASVLVVSAGIWRLPLADGWNRRLIWAAAWLLPIGYVVAAIWTGVFKGGLHIAFVGGFAMLALGVATQVTLGHGGRRDLMLGHPVQVPIIVGLLICSAGARMAMEADRLHFYGWMAVAATLFLAATAAWMMLVLPVLAARISTLRSQRA